VFGKEKINETTTLEYVKAVLQVLTLKGGKKSHLKTAGEWKSERGSKPRHKLKAPLTGDSKPACTHFKRGRRGVTEGG